MKKVVIGILAHVDAGKTTLAEAILFRSGKLRKQGRVDNGDAFLDSHSLEKEKGITIFSDSAPFVSGNTEFTLIDTPGHVDFSSETERVLGILDYAILVINGAEGIQSHTLTLWNLLELYNIPTFIFVTKTDFSNFTDSEILCSLQKELSAGCINFSTEHNEAFHEAVSMCSEEALEKFLEEGSLSDCEIGQLIQGRHLFPCYFGSGLKNTGVDEFLKGLDDFTLKKTYSDEFAAKIYKISRDSNGNRLTHLKITGGSLKVKDSVKCGEHIEKVNQIRISSGAKYETVDMISAGCICTVTGLSSTRAGQGLGEEKDSEECYTQPVMNYRVILPESLDAKTAMPMFRMLEEEDPQLHVSWNNQLQEIHIGLMGEVQIEILKSLFKERFHKEIDFDCGRVLYKETIKAPVFGAGHFEPLRHYAEVHLKIEPLAPGSGLTFETECSEDILDKNWQRLILTHLSEKQHLGVLTGSPITDLKISLISGRAHLKHTEGGDFRQATYRAVRQGLMKAESILLEPYYKFSLEIPREQIGRAISDIRAKSGTFEDPVESGEFTILKGVVPVTEMNGYAMEVAAYTGGKGRLSLSLHGYDICHNAEEVISEFSYSPESDIENTPDSVFCSHGSGFNVKWNEADSYMHIKT